MVLISASQFSSACLTGDPQLFGPLLDFKSLRDAGLRCDSLRAFNHMVVDFVSDI